jgi:hypothetical protein
VMKAFDGMHSIAVSLMFCGADNLTIRSCKI